MRETEQAYTTHPKALKLNLPYPKARRSIEQAMRETEQAFLHNAGL